MFDESYDPADLEPTLFRNCEREGCNGTARNAGLCARHDKPGLIKERIDGLQLRRGLALSLFDQTKDPSWLSEVRAIDRMFGIAKRAHAMAMGWQPRARRAPRVGAAVGVTPGAAVGK